MMVTASVLVADSITVTVFANTHPVLFSSFEFDISCIDKLYTTLKGLEVQDITFVIPTEENVRRELAYDIGAGYIALRDKEKLDSLCENLGIPVVRYMSFLSLIGDKLEDQSVLVIGNGGVLCTLYLKCKGKLEVFRQQGGVKEFLQDLMIKYGKLKIYSITTLYRDRPSTPTLSKDIQVGIASKIKLLWDVQVWVLSQDINRNYVPEIPIKEEPDEIAIQPKESWVKRLTGFLNSSSRRVEKEPKPKKDKNEIKPPAINKSKPKPKPVVKEKEAKSTLLYEEREGDDESGVMELNDPTEYEELVDYVVTTEKVNKVKKKIEPIDLDESEEFYPPAKEIPKTGFMGSAAGSMTMVFITALCFCVAYLMSNSTRTYPDQEYILGSKRFIENRNHSLESSSEWLRDLYLINSLKPSELQISYEYTRIKATLQLGTGFTVAEVKSRLESLNGEILEITQDSETDRYKQFTILVSKV